MNFRKTTNATLSSIETIAETINESAAYMRDIVKQERAEQQAIYAERNKSKSYLHRAIIEDAQDMEDMYKDLSPEMKAIVEARIKAA